MSLVFLLGGHPRVIRFPIGLFLLGFPSKDLYRGLALKVPRDGFSCNTSKQLTGSFYLVVPSKVKVNIKKQLKYKNKQLKYSREINIKKQIYKSNIMRYKNNIRVFNNYVYNCTFLHFVQTNILVSVGSLDILHLEPHLLHLFSVNIQVGSLAHLANLFL